VGSTATLEAIIQLIVSTVGQPAHDFDPFLVARYDFELTNAPGTDSSGNGNTPDCSGSSGTNATLFHRRASGLCPAVFWPELLLFHQDDPPYANLSMP